MKSKGQTLCDGRMQANYKLSPNEEARLIRDETEKRRKLRLLQVYYLNNFNSLYIIIINESKFLFAQVL